MTSFSLTYFSVINQCILTYLNPVKHPPALFAKKKLKLNTGPTISYDLNQVDERNPLLETFLKLGDFEKIQKNCTQEFFSKMNIEDQFLYQPIELALASLAMYNL